MSVKATTSFELYSIQLTSLATGQSYDIRPVTVELNIYEDVYVNVLRGELTISDSNNLISNVPIFGYELLDISFKSNIGGRMFSKRFRVTNVNSATPTKDRNQLYNIAFSSEQDLINENTSVSRAYTKSRISDMVSDIARDYLSIPSLTTLEPTKYLHDYVLPFMDPFTCINFLANRSNSITYRGASFLFFENRDGFHFRSTESLSAQNPVASFHLSPANIRNNPQAEIDDYADSTNIQDYQFITFPDVLSNTHIGMYGARLMVHSLVQKIFRIHDFNYVNEYPQYRHVEPNNSTSSLLRSSLGNSNTYTRLGGVTLTSPESLLRLMPFDEEKVQATAPLSYDGGISIQDPSSVELPSYAEKDKFQFPADAGTTPRTPKSLRQSRITVEDVKVPSPVDPILRDVSTTNITTSPTSEKGFTFTSRQKVERWLLQRDSQHHALFENIRLQMTLPGTTDLTVGDIVNIDLPSMEPVTRDNPQKLDEYYSGRYMVVNLRHRIQMGDNAYYTVVECVKDSVKVGYPV